MRFTPFPMLKGPHQQTMVGWALNMPLTLPSVTETVLLPDNDQIACEVSYPEGWDGTGRTVVLLHGLAGSHASPFLVRMGRKLVADGAKVVRANMRGCGSGAALARKVYHCGRSEDLLPVLKQLKAREPNSPIYLVGFSLGGNIGLKCAGETPFEFAQLVDYVVGICPATDILACARMIDLPENQMYQQHFIRCLKGQLQKRHELYPDIPEPYLPESFTLFEFDEIYTAPQCGFRSALDYYRHASASRVIADIKVPTTILFAGDDPFIDWTALNSLSLPSSMKVHLTKYGGHMGYVGHPAKPGGYRWLDSVVLNWTKAPNRM